MKSADSEHGGSEHGGSERSVSEYSGSWLDRHPAMVSFSAAAGLLGLVQAVTLVWRNQAMGGWQMALGVTIFALFSALLTILLLSPLVLWLRRRHSKWRDDDRLQATWSVVFAGIAALAAWMIADRWVAGPLVPSWLEPWVELAAALAAAWVTTWVQVPGRWLKIAALATPVLIVVNILLLMMSGGSAAGDEKAEAESKESAAAKAGADAPDVILVSIDTLRADRLGAYGHTPSITPEMDRIAAEGVVFARALAAAPWTVPSVASMLTGLPALSHGAGLPLSSGLTFIRSPLDAEQVTLAERFSDAGYRTRAVVANGFLSPQMGLSQGFEQFANPLNNAAGGIFMRDVPLGRLFVKLLPIEKWGDYRAEGITDTALKYLAEDAEGPLFLWAHYIDPHTPFQADPARLDIEALAAEMHQAQLEVLDDGTVVGEVFTGTSHVRGGTLWLGPEDRERIELYYDRAVAYADEHVGRLFEALRERASERPVVAILTADHGEELWDHGHFEHGHDYYREVTQVPLLIWGPGNIPAGRVENGVAGLVDVGPTLLDLAGLTVPKANGLDEGRSLTPRWSAEEGEIEPSPPRFAGGNLYNLPAVLIEDDSYRFILRANGAQELYDVASDPDERHNLVYQHPDLAESYRQTLAPRLAAFLEGSEGAGPAEISPEQLEALRSLGYVQ